MNPICFLSNSFLKSLLSEPLSIPFSLMTAPNMATITASLERSLQNCSLNHHGGGARSSSYTAGLERSSSSEDVSSGNQLQSGDDPALELNSHISLPYHWEQGLDLKTGEIYYINWRTGMKATEDPRLIGDYNTTGYYSDEEEEEEEEEEDDDGSSYDSAESSTESSPSSSTTHENGNKDHVLVVAGCKICMMYHMVPKQVEDCPKCSGQLLHFDRSENGSV